VLTSGCIDSRRALYEAGLCVTLERGGMERAEIGSAVHESNIGPYGLFVGNMIARSFAR
jgi:hypothetical protein